ncbi:hypothetical protein D9M73_231480 [compost metagenome]
MLLASLFGFLGIVVGVVILLIHLISLTSLKQPYFSPIVPFQSKAVYKIFLRWPFIRPTVQVTSFQPPKDEKGKNEDTP